MSLQLIGVGTRQCRVLGIIPMQPETISLVNSQQSTIKQLLKKTQREKIEKNIEIREL